MKKGVFLGFLLILVASFGWSQKDPSIPLKIGHEYRNEYKFEDALNWYKKVIEDFPKTLEAAEASLNRIVILETQIGALGSIIIDFGFLSVVKIEEAAKYRSLKFRLEALKESQELKSKHHSYQVKHARKGKELREEFWRFEKEYSQLLEKLPLPWIPEFKEKPLVPTIGSRDEARKILILGLAPSVDSENRIKYLINQYFVIFCLEGMALGGEDISPEILARWESGKYSAKINTLDFYYYLGTALYNANQFKTAFYVFQKVVSLTEKYPYNKLRYESQKKLKELEKWREVLKYLPKDAMPFVEPLEE